MLISRVIYGSSTRMMAARAIGRSPNLLSLAGSLNTNDQVFNNDVGTFSHRQINGLGTYFRSFATISKQCQEFEGFDDVSNVKNVGHVSKQNEILSSIAQLKKSQDDLIRKQEKMEMDAKLSERYNQGRDGVGLSTEKMKKIEKEIKGILAEQTRIMGTMQRSGNYVMEMEESIERIKADQMKMETMLAGIHQIPQAQKIMETLYEEATKEKTEMEATKEKMEMEATNEETEMEAKEKKIEMEAKSETSSDYAVRIIFGLAFLGLLRLVNYLWKFAGLPHLDL